jgi:hypothetical protein
MAAAAPLPGGWPTLSELKASTFSHLGQAADWFDRIADKTESAFEELAQEVRCPGGVEWEGAAGDQAVNQAGIDLTKVRGRGWDCRDAAQIARRGQEWLEAGKRLALDAVDDAERDGFKVGEDYSVTDTRESSRREQLAERQAQAQAHANFIRHRVAELVANDQHITGEFRAATAGFGTMAFDESPADADDTVIGNGQRDKHVHAVDRTWKREPAPDPNDPGRHPEYPDHKPDGTWAQGNSGLEGYPEEQQAFDEREQVTGIPIDRQKIRVTLTDPNTGRTLTREYDGLEPIPGQPGKYLGLEHKLGTAGLTPNQRVFDGLVREGVPAQGSLNGKPIEVIDTQQINTPHTAAGPQTAPVISPPPNLPGVLDHRTAAPPPVQPAHPAPAPVPPTVLDHPPLPPWLQDPSPPGFQVTPSEPPLYAPLDTPGDVAPSPAHGPPISLHMPEMRAPQAPPMTPEQKQGFLGSVGAMIVGGLALLGKAAEGFR